MFYYFPIRKENGGLIVVLITVILATSNSEGAGPCDFFLGGGRPCKDWTGTRNKSGPYTLGNGHEESVGKWDIIQVKCRYPVNVAAQS